MGTMLSTRQYFICIWHSHLYTTAKHEKKWTVVLRFTVINYMHGFVRNGCVLLFFFLFFLKLSLFNERWTMDNCNFDICFYFQEKPYNIPLSPSFSVSMLHHYLGIGSVRIQIRHIDYNTLRHLASESTARNSMCSSPSFNREVLFLLISNAFNSYTIFVLFYLFLWLTYIWMMLSFMFFSSVSIFINIETTNEIN